jgi:hypothetical protein
MDVKKKREKEMAIVNNAATEEIDPDDTQNEVDNVDVLRSVFLNIGEQDVTEQFLSEQSFSKKQGTPQERMLFLFEQIKSFPDNKSNSDLDNLITELKKTGRKDLLKIKNYKPDLIIGSYIISIKKNRLSEASMSRIILTWIPILIKSISDISLFGSLINLIPQIYNKEKLILRSVKNIEDIKKKYNDSIENIRKKVVEILKGNINLAFFSSDLITAALSTYIAKVIDYPIQIISSTKRSGITTQTIIIQRNLISTLSIVMSYIDDIDKIVELQQKINNEYVTIFLSSIIEYILDFYKGISGTLSNLDDSNISDNLQKAFDDLFLYQEIKTDSKTNPLEEKNITLLCILINKICNISVVDENNQSKSIFIEALTEINSHFEEKKEQFIVNRWTYHLSNDIFKYRYPLNSDKFNDELKEKISNAEILSATFDAMYGHDFPFKFMRLLGNEFLNLFPELEKVNKKYDFNNISDSNIESSCINQTIYLNGFSTLNQHGDKFSIILGKNNNFLVTNKDEMYYRIPEKPWKITLSPLIKQKLYSSVDFVSGEPAISLLLVEQVNYIKSLKDPVYVFENVDLESIKKKFEDFSRQIDNETNYNEIFNPCSLFDGAAPYGGKPIYFLDPYFTIFNFEIQEKNRDKIKCKFQIKTNTNDNTEELTRKWLEKRIDSTKQITILEESNIETSLLIPNNTETVFNNNVIKFNQILGTILNSSNRISNDTKDDIIQIFIKIIGNINQEVEKLHKSSDSVTISSRSSNRRSKTSKDSESEGNYFTKYDQFNNSQIKQMIDLLKPEFNYKSKITKTFEKIINNYALLITESQDDDYQNKITTLLSILEMCVRIIFVSNTNGIFKALPDYSEIVINEKVSTTVNEANKFEDLVEDKFTKDIKKFYKQLIVNFSVLKQNREKEELALARSRANNQSVTKVLESNLSKIANQSNINVVGTPKTRVSGTIVPSKNEAQVSGLNFSSSSENSPVKMDEEGIVGTQIDNDENTNVSNVNEDNERLQNIINGLNEEKQILQNKITGLEKELKRCEETLRNTDFLAKREIEELKNLIEELIYKLKLCDEENERLGDKLKRCEEENERLKQQSEEVSPLAPPISTSSAPPSESSFETNPLKSFRSKKNSTPRSSPRLRNKTDSSLSSLPTNEQQEQEEGLRFQKPTISSSLKRRFPRKKGGTFKQYQNKYNYSIKNRPHFKNKSIKQYKRKHTKTYKRN